MGRPLDTLVTLRPEAFELMTEPERHAWTRKRLRTLGDFFATPAVNDNAARPRFMAIWARESKRVGEGREVYGEGEHVHILCRCGSADLQTKLETMLKKHLMGRHEVDVRPASQRITRLDNGWWCDAGSYILKAVAPAGWRFNKTIPHRQSGPIHGARTGMSANLRALLPANMKKSRTGWASDDRQAA